MGLVQFQRAGDLGSGNGTKYREREESVETKAFSTKRSVDCRVTAEPGYEGWDGTASATSPETRGQWDRRSVHCGRRETWTLLA